MNNAEEEMVKELPEFIVEWCKKEAKEKGHIIVGIDMFNDEEYKSFKGRHGLNFSYDLYWHGLDGFKINLVEYLLRSINYSRKYIKIYLNGICMDKLTPNMIPAIQYPQEIDLSNTLKQ